MRFLRALLTHVSPLALLACGGGDLVLPSEAGPARIDIFGGNEQTGTAGAPLAEPLVVRVRDAQDRVVAGLRVAFVPGAGAVSPDTVETDEEGLASAEWVLGGGAGTQAVDANVVGTNLTVRFTASAGTGTASRIELARGDAQSGAVGTALPDSLVVRVEDRFGNPVPGVEVTWSADIGEVSPASVTTGADGLAGARRILGARSGEQTATATVPGLEGSPVTFTHTAVPGTAASVVLVSGSGQTGSPGGELNDPLVVRVVDRSGNGIPGQAVTWVVATGGGRVSEGTTETDAEGFAETRWTLGPNPGANTLNAVVSGVGVVGFTASAAGGGGGGGPGPSASRSTVVADPTSIQAVTGSSTITVTVRDGSGSPVQGATVRLQATGSGNTVTQPTGPTGADGVATGTLRSTVPGTKIVSATINGSVQVSQTAQVTVTLTPASRVELLEGDDQTAPAGSEVSVRPAVRVTNELGEPVAGFVVTFVVTGGGGSVRGASQTTNSDGVARVGGWTLGPTPGANTLEARAGSLQGSPVVFSAEGTSAGGGLRFEFTIQPADVDEDEPFTVEVTLRDGTGATVPLSGIDIQLGLFREGRDRPSNQDLEGERIRPTVNGVALFPGLRVSRDDEEFRLRARSDALPDVPPVFSNSFDVD